MRGIARRTGVVLIIAVAPVALAFGQISAAGEDSATGAQASPFQFRHHFVDDALPGSEWGQTALLDVDSDGDLDFVTGRSRGEIRWYEFRGGAAWKMHVLGTDSPSEVGAAALDVDGDGRVDLVTGGAWYRQPVNPSSAGAASGEPLGLWERIVFDPSLKGVHDVVAADLDGDRKPEVITQADQSDVRFYTIPKDDPRKPWTFQRVCAAVHAGLAAGDLDGDGDADIVRSQIWLENVDGGKEWKEHGFCGIAWADRKEVSFYHLASRCWVTDINGDGRNDIVLTEAEFSGARVAWFEAPPEPRTVPWKAHILPQSGPDPRGPYHSLQVADFDLDGDLDIFSGEMERFGVAPHRWFIWENRGGEFVERVILDRGLGTHEAVAGDVDGDGDIDLVGKLWSPVPDNANAGRNHVDYLENLLQAR